MTSITELKDEYTTMLSNLLTNLNTDYGIDTKEKAAVAYLLLSSYMDILSKISELA